mgnify:FL=1
MKPRPATVTCTNGAKPRTYEARLGTPWRCVKCGALLNGAGDEKHDVQARPR